MPITFESLNKREEKMSRKIAFAGLVTCMLCLCGCDFVDRNATYQVTVDYYLFIEDNETQYTVSGMDNYSTEYNEAHEYDTSISLYPLTRGQRRQLRETYNSTSFGAALTKSEITNEKPQMKVYHARALTEIKGSVFADYAAQYAFDIKNDSGTVLRSVSGTFTNKEIEDDVLESSFDDETLGTIHVLAVYKSEKMSYDD
jgi:hypothetical protein